MPAVPVDNGFSGGYSFEALRSLKNAGKVIGVSEADKNGEKNEERHGAEKEMVVTASWCGRWSVGGPNDRGCQSPSKDRA